ncbi:hypothetical protein PAPYR_9057 [Paratrimastix pyriformis]|uniref:Uncharacterized protein n=1 Tax=Paratrimastix pyriformis TaxID=342808 RepID=A0ABQ8UCS9_9EUKA|nr:hypothetical protein PAPYR_9057 [Paratrimastix pyriformis]
MATLTHRLWQFSATVMSFFSALLCAVQIAEEVEIDAIALTFALVFGAQLSVLFCVTRLPVALGPNSPTIAGGSKNAMFFFVPPFVVGGLAVLQCLDQWSPVPLVAWFLWAVLLFFLPPLLRAGLGEALVFLATGPLLTSFVFYSLTSHFAWLPFAIGIPCGLLSVAAFITSRYSNASRIDPTKRFRHVRLLFYATYAIQVVQAILILLSDLSDYGSEYLLQSRFFLPVLPLFVAFQHQKMLRRFRRGVQHEVASELICQSLVLFAILGALECLLCPLFFVV